MSHHRSKQEQLRLGEQAVYLRDVEQLLWRQIAERLDGCDIPRAIAYYKKYKAALKATKEKMNFGQIEEFSSRYGIEGGWVWLYENGFKRRVPMNVQDKIEEAKLKSW